MKAIVFETPGVLDLKAITTFGINVKIGNNPIGFFGTGLKYAIAVLVRAEIPITIYTNGGEYVFYKKTEDFRAKAFDFVMLKQRNSLLGRWTAKKMPFTTEFGKNWELWMAFRELESNTRDEGGTSFLYDEKHEPPVGKAEHTWIVVEGDKFFDVWSRMSEVFLTGAETVYDYTSRIQVIKKPSSALYYRGLKVMDLPKPSVLTYNILQPISLTEDRTVKYEFEIRDSVMGYIARDCKDGHMLNEVISADEKTTWEGSLPFDQLYTNPSSQFLEIIRKKKQRAVASTYVAPRIDRLYTNSLPQEPEKLPFKLRPGIKSWENASAAINELGTWLLRYSEMFDYDSASNADADVIAREFLDKYNKLAEPELASIDDSDDDIPF